MPARSVVGPLRRLDPSGGNNDAESEEAWSRAQSSAHVLVLIPVAIAAGTVPPTLPANAAAANTHLVIPKCKRAQIHEWLVGPSGRYNTSRNYTTEVIYTNLVVPRVEVGAT